MPFFGISQTTNSAIVNTTDASTSTSNTIILPEAVGNLTDLDTGVRTTTVSNTVNAINRGLSLEEILNGTTSTNTTHLSTTNEPVVRQRTTSNRQTKKEEREKRKAERRADRRRRREAEIVTSAPTISLNITDFLSNSSTLNSNSTSVSVVSMLGNSTVGDLINTSTISSVISSPTTISNLTTIGNFNSTTSTSAESATSTSATTVLSFSSTTTNPTTSSTTFSTTSSTSTIPTTSTTSTTHTTSTTSKVSTAPYTCLECLNECSDIKDDDRISVENFNKCRNLYLDKIKPEALTDKNLNADQCSKLVGPENENRREKCKNSNCASLVSSAASYAQTTTRHYKNGTAIYDKKDACSAKAKYDQDEAIKKYKLEEEKKERNKYKRHRRHIPSILLSLATTFAIAVYGYLTSKSALEIAALEFVDVEMGEVNDDKNHDEDVFEDAEEDDVFEDALDHTKF